MALCANVGRRRKRRRSARSRAAVRGGEGAVRGGATTHKGSLCFVYINIQKNNGVAPPLCASPGAAAAAAAASPFHQSGSAEGASK